MKKIMRLLYHSLDGELTAKERKRLRKALSGSEALRSEMAAIRQIREGIERSKKTAFSPGFVDRVIEQLKPASKANPFARPFSSELIHFFRPIAVAVCFLIALLAAWNMVTAGEFSISGLFGEPEVTVEEAYDPIITLLWEEL